MTFETALAAHVTFWVAHCLISLAGRVARAS